MELEWEYRFDYSKAKPNRFAKTAGKRRVVVLNEDAVESKDPKDSKDLKDDKT